jgi:hypothetical protein
MVFEEEKVFVRPGGPKTSSRERCHFVDFDDTVDTVARWVIKVIDKKS